MGILKFHRAWKVQRLEVRIQGLYEQHEKFRDPWTLEQMGKLRAQLFQLKDRTCPHPEDAQDKYYGDKGMEVVRQCRACGHTVRAAYNARTLVDANHAE